jgi:hypothetical protein
LYCFQNIQEACIKLSKCLLCITGIPNGDSKSETENETLVKAMKMEESCEAQSNRTENAGKGETGNAGNEETGNAETGNAGNAETWTSGNEETGTSGNEETENAGNEETENAGNEETEIKLESDDTYTFAYSVIFKEDHGQVNEITEEHGGDDEQNNDGEYRIDNKGEDLRVVDMEDEEEEKEGDKVQVTIRVLKLILISFKSQDTDFYTLIYSPHK